MVRNRHRSSYDRFRLRRLRRLAPRPPGGRAELPALAWPAAAGGDHYRPRGMPRDVRRLRATENAPFVALDAPNSTVGRSDEARGGRRRAIRVAAREPSEIHIDPSARGRYPHRNREGVAVALARPVEANRRRAM